MGKVLEDTELENRWIAALESGDYEQGKNLLYTSRGFCCLGVLCDIQKEELGGRWDRGNFRYGGDKVVEDSDVEVPNGPKRQHASCLADINDDGETFKEIAQRIREGNMERPEDV